MSLTTVAGPVQPDEVLLNLPPSRPERFQRSDFIAAGLVFLVTLGVYIATLAPNVTLEDSGELITAAAKFGVGHPPGYPLWTMLGFLLSHILPFGDLAWRINLLCAIFGGLSNAILALLVCHSGRWLLQRWTTPDIQAAVRPYVFYTGLFAGLVIGFSDVMWSQAVISAVHGTLNALFVNAVLLLFYLWIIEPQKTHRLVFTVFVFSLGLTNHHTLVQIIPAFLLAAALVQLIPLWLHKPAIAPSGTFFSVFLAINLFSLSILVYISWLSGFDPDKNGPNELQTISQTMAWLIFSTTAIVSFFYLREFRLRLFLTGVATALSIFAFAYYLLDPSDLHLVNPSMVPDSEWALRYTRATAPHFWLVGSYVHPGWLQGLIANAHAGQPPVDRHVSLTYVFAMLGLAVVALGMLYTSNLNRRLIIGVFIVGWIGLLPYAYEPFASSSHPPMNWGYAKLRSGFYYEVTRQQYPKSLPTLIKMTFGKATGIVDKNAQLDATIGLPDYWPRLGKTFYYYGDNLQQNFTAPLIFLTLAVLFYIRRCDWPQVHWFIFLAVSFFLLGFMLLIIAPQESFDFERNLQYKVFHIQSHCIFVLLMSYGALAIMVYLHEHMPDVPARVGVAGFGIPAVFLSLLPFWNNFDGCSQAGHWFGYDYGADMMRDMDPNAVYYGGSDPGRFVPTYMAFVESQQDDRWKADWTVHPAETARLGRGFDRRDVTVITQNALCDTYYANYIRDQYDPRFRPKPDQWTPFERWLGRDKAYPKEPITCTNDQELYDCWTEYRSRPDVAERIASGQPELRPGSNDVFEINGIVAQKIFEKNKKGHTFYIEQSLPIGWMYPYLLPWGLIFKLNPEPMSTLPQAAIDADRKFWDAYSARLLSDPRFRMDPDAILTFAKLCYWHADLYSWRHLDKEQEYWLRMSISLCPQLAVAVESLSRLLTEQKRFDDAKAVIEQAELADPRNDVYPPTLDWIETAQAYSEREQLLRAELAQSPYDVQLNLDFARLLEDEGKFDEVNDRLRIAAGLTNWSREAMADVVQYYIETVHNNEAAIAFLEARAKIDPKAGELIYSLAALESASGHRKEAIHYLTQAMEVGGTNAMISARVDPRFGNLRDDPRFQALLNGEIPTNAPAVNPAATNPSAVMRPMPVPPGPPHRAKPAQK